MQVVRLVADVAGGSNSQRDRLAIARGRDRPGWIGAGKGGKNGPIRIAGIANGGVLMCPYINSSLQPQVIRAGDKSKYCATGDPDDGRRRRPRPSDKYQRLFSGR